MVLLLLLLASGCVQAPQLPPRVVEEAEPAALIASVVPSDESAVTVRLALAANPGTAALPAEPLAVDVYLPAQLSPAGFPLLGSAPVSRHVHDAPVAAWPLELDVSVAAVAGATLVAWLDVDRDGEPGPGDRIGEPVALSSADFDVAPPRLSGTIGRIHTTLAASPERRLVQVSVSAPEGAPSEGRLLLIGYAAGLEPGGRPDFRWSSPGTRRSWPETVSVRVPAMPLWIMAGLDRGGDGQLDPTDLIGPPAEGFDAGQQDVLALSVEQQLGQRR